MATKRHRVGKRIGKRHRLSRTEARAKALGLVVVTEDDPEPYEMGDAETEMPDRVLWMGVYRDSDVDEYTGLPRHRAVPLASLGSIGVNANTRASDPYLREMRADLLDEAIGTIEAEHERSG